MFPEWLIDRGAAVSFGVVAVVLMLAAGPVSRALRVSAEVVEGEWWWGGPAFLVVARAAAVALASPGLVLDPWVLVRFTDDLWPVAGAAAALAVTWWRSRGHVEAGAAWAAAVAGLAIAAATYDLACPLRAGCAGAPSSAPFAFPMHGLTEARLATPFIEGVVLLVVIAVAVRLLDRWDARRVGWALLGAVAATRLALLPVSAGGVDVIEVVPLAGALLVAAGMALRSRAGGYLVRPK